MYELKQLDVNLLQAARSQWSEQLDALGEESIPFNGYFIYLGYTEYGLTINNAPNLFHYCFTQADQVIAMFELSVVHLKAADCYLKVLSVRTAPVFDTRAPDTAENTFLMRMQKITQIYSNVIFSVLGLAESHFSAKMVKIYGNNQAGADFFANFIAAANQNKLPERFGYDLNRYGNWLHISM